ncbi:50S ribosomal protein L17 [Candidatus Azambacteria bacterium RIFOXYD1_FULL_42_11]|uniref:Large ribosomal subunit protein bL17 n=4 Tax=Candidatus Azamiibacteriota TaxID=1752741 RepID=A0A0G0ZCZ4_9BACT|nr:MAG: 50S ribosomal protein L17 [Candidatus Azambacteria bacterium GW2011_GWB1_42_17]KKS46572.1 MAG: 50S ribosomal protein L17 [Candidatus Azambacteria bacterium GW2011_GWA1_42_19]KKS76064.1 MAG: 50S ribosomal protein L17 [Candidatus Azambacteria bacterium GW2011_GWA2_42_9]KKS88878.1 MAG: 50S ribosomal protein L17 [Parcubacteria group bacterium GW2011_GWC1_43_11]OGD43146.1 MAG: 50S ribosomal protein L17 [Candidatus Azambacteria bacterium RIFOXYD1_FULL_42_11]
MRHLRKNRKFGRLADYRKSFLWNLTNSLIFKEKIKTTEMRAKEIRSLIERVVTRAKTDNLNNRRLLAKNLNGKTVAKLFKDIAPQYKERAGGYTRIIKIGSRKNDGAKTVLIEFVK